MRFMKKIRLKQHRKGIALVIALIFITIFSTLAVAMFTMSSNNTIVASNLHTVNKARSAAESGLEVLRYYIEQITIPSSVSENDRFSTMANQLIYLTNVGSNNLPIYYDHNPADPHIHIGYSNSPVTLSQTDGQSFYARITPDGTNGLIVSITGESGEIDRNIISGFTYGTQPHSVFDYGIATRGPLLMSGQTSVADVDVADGELQVKSDVFIDTDITLGDSFSIDNKASVAGDVHIVDENANYSIGTKSSIGGETGGDAEDHVFVGADPVDFPYPDTEYFR